MKSGQILHGVKYSLKRGKSKAVPQIANIQLSDGSLTAAVIFEGFTWAGDELVPVKKPFQSLYESIERAKVK